ncbi:MAG: hypothetical protein CM1200mP38_4240 [Dehalococcoidia bacterium]|nr:MAG: hypothetical protein CM1200mP38_4240 [Dehalococcoidia bacterium]
MNTLNKNRIDILLSKSVAEGRPVLSPFITIGYPDKQKSIDMGIAILKHGGDMLELGVPFRILLQMVLQFKKLALRPSKMESTYQNALMPQAQSATPTQVLRLY